VPGSVLRDMMRVANLVHKPPPTVKGMSVKLWSKDDFPADCCPTITSYVVSILEVKLRTVVAYLRQIKVLAGTAYSQFVNGIKKGFALFAAERIFTQ
jgi:hypothetical protein